MRNFCYAVLGTFIVLSGCNTSELDFDNLKVENLTSDLAVPLGTAKYTFGELLEDLEDPSNYTVDENGEIMFSYTQSVDYSFTPDLFTVTDNSETTTLAIPDATGCPCTYRETVSFNQTYEAMEDEVLDSIFHASTAILQVSVSSTLTSSVPITYDLRITSTTSTLDGTPIVLSGTLNAGSVQTSLANYVTKMTEVAGLNEIDIEIDLSADFTAADVFSSESIAVTIEFLTQDFDIVFGKMGRDTVDFNSQTLDLSFFENIGDDGIKFGTASMTFDVTSSFGIPIGLGLAGVYGEESDGTRTYLSGNAVNTPRVINAATLNTSTLTPIEEQTTIIINSGNSSFGQLMGTSPSRLGFDVTGITNSSDKDADNFVTPDASLSADITIEVPLTVSLINVTHTLDFDIAGGVDFSDVDSLQLRLITVNELPINATLDMFIMNSGGDTLYQVLDKSALDQPFLNQDRSVREPKIAVEDIPLGKQGTTALSEADLIRVVLTLNSPSSKTSEEIYVKLLSTAGIEVSLGIRGILDVKL